MKGGSLLGGVLLVAGSSIGAAMLGLPVLTGNAGFVPSVAMLFVSWAFMAATGLLTLEVNLWFPREVSFVTMAQTALGRWGKVATWICFLALFYALMVAYVVGSGSLASEMAEEIMGWSLSQEWGSTLSVVLFGWIIFRGVAAVDRVNRLLMAGLLGSYGAMLTLGSSHVEAQNLERVSWGSACLTVPAMIISFGFHNLVPTLSGYLHRNRKRLTLMILIGSAIPLGIYVAWEWLILGIVPVGELRPFGEVLGAGETATMLLRRELGVAWVMQIAQGFAFFAIVTSLLGVAMSFVDFLRDGLSLPKTAKSRALLCALVLGPSYLVALGFPQVFLLALSYAGAFGAATLFGLLPVLMVWRGRYVLGHGEGAILPGGRVALVLVGLVALAIIGIGVILKF